MISELRQYNGKLYAIHGESPGTWTEMLSYAYDLDKTPYIIFPDKFEAMGFMCFVPGFKEFDEIEYHDFGADKNSVALADVLKYF